MELRLLSLLVIHVVVSKEVWVGRQTLDGSLRLSDARGELFSLRDRTGRDIR
jgi:hypothetical protein